MTLRGDDSTRVTVVVVTWRGVDMIADCLESLRGQTEPHRLVVVDNASDDGTADILQTYREATVVRTSANLGFAGGAARGLAEVTSEFVAFLNDDAVAETGWLEALLSVVTARPAAAAVTSLLLRQDSEPPTVNNAGVLLLDNWYGADRAPGQPAASVRSAAEVFGFSGGAALVRTAALRAVGGFPAEFFLYYEDTDVSWRLRLAGWEIWYEPTAVVRHRHGASSGLGSRTFALHNERNRLLMLVRCAPAVVVAEAWVRFLLTTASLTARRMPGGRGQTPWNMRPWLRLTILASALGQLRPALRTRRAVRPGSRGVDPRRWTTPR